MRTIRSVIIGRVIEQIEALAYTLHDATAGMLAHELAQQLARAELNLLVVGQFKRGKSSLINALLSADAMPTGALPLTGVATVIRYGDVRQVEVSFHDQADRRNITVDDLPLYVSEQYNPANRLGVERVDVFWPSETIRGFALFDTPGIGSTYKHNTAAAHATLPRADAAILVAGPEPPIGAEELQYARDVLASSEHLFVVLNKSDLAGSALSEILQFTHAAVNEVMGDREDVEVVPLSATRAREAQREGGEDTAFAGFVKSLRSFVEHQGGATRVRSLRRRAAALLQRLDTLLAMRHTALALPGVERERRKYLVQRALQTVDDRVRSLELMVDDDVRRLRIALEGAMDSYHDRDELSFRSLGVELAKEPSTRRRDERLQRAVAERASAWREDAVEQASRQLRSDTEKYGRLLGEVEASALEAGCDVLHVDAGTLTPRRVEFAPPKLELVASLMPTTGLELFVAYVIDLLPAPMRAPVLKRRYDDILARELDALKGKLRYGIGHDLERWRRSVRTTISSSIVGTREAVLAAFGELASETHTSQQTELTRVRELQAEVRRVREEIALPRSKSRDSLTCIRSD